MPMPFWIIPALIIVVTVTGFNILVKLSSGFESYAAAVVLQAAGLVVALIAYLIFQGTQNPLTQLNSKIWYALFAGALVGVTNLSIILMYHSGAPLSVATPFTRIGSLALVVIAGILFFKEPLTATKALGFALSLGGIYLLMK
jgi:drug/metabolite transporter (DMT)-like permease